MNDNPTAEETKEALDQKCEAQSTMLKGGLAAEDIVVHATQYGIFVQKRYYRDGYATFARVFCRTYIGL